jgi:hypothetical protein
VGRQPEIYVPTDVEADGPCPGLNSMLSFASVAIDPTRGIGKEAVLSTFSANLELCPGARPDPDTMDWWRKQPVKIWEAHRANTEKPELAMVGYVAWLESLPGKPIFVGYPAAFDFTWIYYYLHRFAGGKNPLVRNAIDVESYAMAFLGEDYMAVGKRNWPKHWFDPTLKHNHVAADDALAMGMSFVRMMNDRRSKVWGAPLGEAKPCPTCSTQGSVIDGPHTYGDGCRIRKFR